MAEKKVKEYVAYGNLGQYKPGDVVNPAGWSADEWAYMVAHEVVVVKNSPNDPTVLAEKSEEKEVDVPDGRTAEERRDSAAMAAHEAAVKESQSAEGSKTAPESPKTPETSKESEKTPSTPTETPKTEPKSPAPKKEG